MAPFRATSRVPAGTRAGRASPNSAATLLWRRIPYEVNSGARNMALDHALAASLAGPGSVDGAGVFRLYGWARPTLSLGRNEPAAAYPLQELRAAGHDVVRRPTGGRAVLHGRELTYAVIVPLRAFGGARGAYARINEGLAAGLRRLGVPAELTGDADVRALGPDAGPCFQAPAVGEVIARGRKLVGSAQARIGGALLQHGSILLDGDQGPLAGSSPPITLRELVGDVSIDVVAGVVAESVGAALGGVWADGEVSSPERALVDELESGRYALESWTLRR